LNGIDDCEGHVDMIYYAHSNGSDKDQWQVLSHHLTNTAQLALDLGRGVSFTEYAYLAALLHDIGKYSQPFQRRLMGENIKIDHSTAGAKEVIRLFQENFYQKIVATLLAYCIAGHHSGLPDYGSVIDTGTEGTLKARLKKRIPDYQDYALDINSSQLVLPGIIPIKPIKNCVGFSLAFFTRMVYSLLVDADFLETETYVNQGKKPRGGYEDIAALCQRFNRFLEQFSDPNSLINQQRSNILAACVAKAEEPPGLFSLTVPTGGGKTFASMAFALNHARHHGMERIIYVIPYTSIIEQNAAVFKNVLDDENVLEHHSNFDWGNRQLTGEAEDYDDKTNAAREKIKLATENWDIPVVVTTNVQFFESLFSNRSSRCRKIHNIAKSVIIFDEAQMLPREYLKPSLYAIQELVTNYATSAVLCTATQPAVDRFFPAGTQIKELAPDPPGLYTAFKRVQVINAGVINDAELIQQINDQPQVLCIVNTRKHAKGLFEGIEVDGHFHLSTLMCPVHRKQTIAEIRRRLKQGQTCRVVSTQIMEAGIDVDFPVGYRAISGLDSIIQAAGRVNREGRQNSGTLFVFEPDSSFVKRTPAYIRQGAEAAKEILRRFGDPVCLDAVQAYFRLVYELQDTRAFDARNILACFEKGIPNEANFDFRTAAERFKLIEDNTLPVVIPYDEAAVSLLREVRYSSYPASFSRQLQVYTVNIYAREYEALLSRGLIDLYGDTFAVLNDMGFYHAGTGLVIPESSGGEAIFFDG
jgi:CRISPR-associated endonuclease/helicase Cas3